MTPRKSHIAYGSAGFTMIELLVCLALGALLGALLAPPWIAMHESARFKGQIEAVAESLRLTRDRAIVGGRVTEFQIARDTRHDGSLVRAGTMPVRRLPDGLQLAAADEIAIDFFPDGSSSGGAIRLEQRGRAADITVDWLTGDIAVTVGGGHAGG